MNNHHANEDRKSVQKKICIRTLTFLGKTMWCVFRVTRAVNIDKAHSKINHKKERKTPTYFFSLTEKKNLNIDAPENRRPDKKARLFQEKAWRKKTKNTLNEKSFAGMTKASWKDMGKYSICLYVPLGWCVLPATNFWRPLRLWVLFPYTYLIPLIAFFHLEKIKNKSAMAMATTCKKCTLVPGYSVLPHVWQQFIIPIC